MRITVFAIVLSLIILLYGGMHYYFYCKLIALLPDRGRLLTIILFVFGCSVFVAEFLAYRHIQSMAVMTLTWIAFMWMGYVFVFFFVSIAFDVGTVITQMAGLNRFAIALLSPQRTIWVLILTSAIVVQGYWAARQVNVERIQIASGKISDSLRIVQISDLHLGMLSSVEQLVRLVKTINDLKPDIIVSTGDLVETDLNNKQRLLDSLLQLKAKLGKYAIYGNHEVLAGLNTSKQFISAAGFTLLSGTEITLNHEINIAGVDDPMVRRSTNSNKITESELLKHHANGHFTLLLKHQPTIDKAAVPWFDLQLSGHVHAGQVFPFGLLTWLSYRTPMGLSRVDQNAWLYVSRGTGFWGPPIRVLAPPEIAVFDLQPLR